MAISKCPRVQKRIFCNECGYSRSEALYCADVDQIGVPHIDSCIGRRAGCTCDLHMFIGVRDEELIESVLYTDDGMFGDIQFEAEEELKFRYPPPSWARKHMLLGNDGVWRWKPRH